VYELRTTTASADDHPELVIALEDPALAEQGQWWIASLERRLAAGERFEVGRLPVIDGLPVHPTLRLDGAVALHARVIEDYRNERTTLALDAHARLAQRQRRFATAFGPFDPPHWLMLVLACPRWKQAVNVLTREASGDAMSGWVIACDQLHCCACTPDEQLHCPEGEWLMIDVAEIANVRPELMPFLGLAPGHRIASPFGDRRIESFPLEHGLALARLAGNVIGPYGVRMAEGYTVRALALLTECSPTHATEDSATIELDFEREHDVYRDPNGVDSLILPGLRERYGLSAAGAQATLARARSSERLREYARWTVRDKLTAEQRDLVETALDVPEPERWNAINEAARKLVPITHKPFTAWKPIVELFDRGLEYAKMAARFRG
jgi:hypothetical protein